MLNILNGVVFATIHPDTLVVRKVNEGVFQKQNEVSSLVLRQIETTRGIENIKSVKAMNTEDGRCKGRDRTNGIQCQRDVWEFYVRVSSKGQAIVTRQDGVREVSADGDESESKEPGG